MFLRILISIIILSLGPVTWSQVDTTKRFCPQILYEIYSSKQDSFKFHNYYAKKEPFFEKYFNYFSKEELDSLNKKCLEVMRTTIGDSLKYPQYMEKVEYYWNVNRMLFGIRCNKSRREQEQYFDSFGDTIKLEFIINGKRILLNNNFRVYYILNTKNVKKLIEASISKDVFLAPNVGKDTVGKVIFEYRNKFYDITFCDNYLHRLKREIKLTLVYETKPYSLISLDDRNIVSAIKAAREYLNEQKNMNGIFFVRTTRFGMAKSSYFQKKSDFFKKNKIIMAKAKK